jgi:putative tricarboxylic transport membrane protein
VSAWKHRDRVSSLVCIGFGVVFCIGSIRYGDVRSGIPSAGLFPFMGGVILIALSLTQLISVIAARSKERDQSKRETFFSQSDSWKRLLLALFALFAYGLILKYLGLLITTFLFVTFLLRFIEPQKWTITITTALVASGSSYVLFHVWLKVDVPKGILGL